MDTAVLVRLIGISKEAIMVAQDQTISMSNTLSKQNDSTNTLTSGSDLIILDPIVQFSPLSLPSGSHLGRDSRRQAQLCTPMASGCEI